MSIARDLSLKETKEGLILVQKPTAIIESRLDELSHNNKIQEKNIVIDDNEFNLDKSNKLKENSYWLKAKLTAEPNATAGFSIAQKKDANGKTINETVIGYDAANHQIYVDRTNSGGKLNEQALKRTIDVNDSSNTIQLEILLDKSSLEVFVNNGEAALTTYIYPDEDANHIAAFSKNGKATINSLTVWNMSSVKQ
jgi:sucrose-6-phosphate hydrolase SacC (GH32 family)